MIYEIWLYMKLIILINRFVHPQKLSGLLESNKRYAMIFCNYAGRC